MGKDYSNNKPQRNIPIRAAAVLLCLTLLTTYLVSGLFARYAQRAQGSDYARVAKFSITSSGTLSQSIATELAPGKPKTETLVIENNSEVAVEYTITVTNETGNLPLRFQMEKDGVFSETQAGSVTFTDNQLPGSHTDTYTLYINWKAAGETDLALMGMVDYITVTVTVTQID